MKKMLFAALAVLGLSAALTAQTLRGEIRDINSARRLEGALVVFSMPGKPEISTYSDAEGKFEITPLPAGYGVLTAQLKNYVRYHLPLIEIATGKQQVLDIFLTSESRDAMLDAVDIVAQRPMQTVLPIGATVLPKEQTLNYPVTYYDPARLAMAVAPGVAQGDDGTNAMSVRGNNPAYVRWKLNGLDIVSPNHLPNAGTLSDQATTASGGVLMLSAQMLDHAALVTGTGAIEYNDGVGGVMDLRLRKGNTRRHEQTIQAGLVGLDATIEGPLGKKKQNSYLINYRYSTVGLLGKMGVSFGGEKITFQDLAVHLSLKGIKEGEWSFFFLGGKSKNLFSRPDSALTYKDLFNIDFDSKTMVTGFSKRNSWGRKHATQFGLSLSLQDNDHDQSSLMQYIASNSAAGWLSLQNSHRIAFNRNTALSFGYHLQTFFEEYGQKKATFNGNYQSHHLYEEGFPLQGWVRIEHFWLSGKLGVIGGVHPVFDGDDEDFYFSPRVQTFWRPSSRHYWVFSLTTGAQRQPLLRAFSATYFTTVLYALRYKYQPEEQWAFTAEAYSQSLSGQNVTSKKMNAFSGFNEAETAFTYNYYVSDGRARMNGLELTARRNMSGGWFAQANATLMKSEYQGSDKIWRRSRWDVGHIANIMGGKEWAARRYKEGKARYRGVSGRAVLRGGFRNAPVNLWESEQQQTTVLDYSNGLPFKDKEYFRIDARFFWKRHIYGRYTSILAIEVQNLTGRKNIAWHYYDALDYTVKTKYQLGIIPNLSWRWHF